MSRTYRPGIVVLLLAAASAGCVADRPYRLAQPVLYEKLQAKDFDPTQTRPKEGEPPLEGKYRLAFMEFNDRGQLFEPAQTGLAVDQIKLARAGRPATEALVVVFVHGWKNNAKLDNGNVWGFRQVLAGLAFNNPERDVLGIYIGWRGATISAPVLKEFTFFDRHLASQKVPVPVMPGEVERLIAAAKTPDTTTKPATIVFIGHSFGGAVLEGAITPLMTKAIQEARSRGQSSVEWPADMVMLLNEAQEAAMSFSLIDLMNRELQPRPVCAVPPAEARNVRPAVISISSTGDVATRGMFPGAQLVGPRLDLPRDTKLFGVGRRQLHYATTAHIGKLRSHLIGDPDHPDMKQAMTLCQATLDFSLSNGAEDFKYKLIERPDAPNRTPYWVMHMPTTIVPDHSTIFTQPFRDFVISLIGVATMYDPHNQLLQK